MDPAVCSYRKYHWGMPWRLAKYILRQWAWIHRVKYCYVIPLYLYPRSDGRMWLLKIVDVPRPPRQSATTISMVKLGVSCQNGWFTVEPPTKMDDFLGSPILGRLHMGTLSIGFCSTSSEALSTWPRLLRITQQNIYVCGNKTQWMYMGYSISIYFVMGYVYIYGICGNDMSWYYPYIHVHK